MILKETIEYIISESDTGEELDYFDVEFEANPHWSDDSYNDEFGTVKIKPYPVVDSEITWDMDKYTHEQNILIDNYLTHHHDSIAEAFCDELKKQSEPDY